MTKAKVSRAKLTRQKILEAFAIQGLATLAQVQTILDISYNQARSWLKQMVGVNPALWTQGEFSRPWIRTGSGRREFLYALTEIGAKELANITGERHCAVSQKDSRRNLQHNLALVDIAIVLQGQKIPFRMDRRLYIADQDDGEYLRPDVLLQPVGSKQQHLIELEQSRLRLDLENRLLERMFRWDELLSGTERGKYCSDILVFFSLEEHDDYTIATWMAVLDTLIQKINRQPVFTIWFMSFSDFIKSPTFDLAKYKKLAPSQNPDEMILQIERERVLFEEIKKRTLISNTEYINARINAYLQENRGELRKMQADSQSQEFFLDLCDRLYKDCANPFSTGYEKTSIPWLAIGIVRFWLEIGEFTDLRQRLIWAISETRASYARGLASAADAMERMVWNVLFRFFGFARGGPLTFYVILGSEKEGNRRSGLIPVVKIQSWDGVRETEAEITRTEESIAWLIDLLMQYQIELGLTKENKRGKSSYVLNQPAQSDSSETAEASI